MTFCLSNKKKRKSGFPFLVFLFLVFHNVLALLSISVTNNVDMANAPQPLIKYAIFGTTNLENFISVFSIDCTKSIEGFVEQLQ